MTLRMFRLLAPQRRLVAAVVALAIGSCVLAAIGPRILGHATDLIFSGVLGQQLPAGITRQEAIAAAQARGDTVFADLLSGNHVTPGVGIDFGAVRRTLTLALGLYFVFALAVWAQARVLKHAIQRTVTALRAAVQEKLHRLSLSYVDSCRRGELLGRLTHDIVNIEDALVTAVSALPTAVLTLVAVTVMMLTLSPLLAIITMMTVPLCVLITRPMLRRSGRLFAAKAANVGQLNAHVEEVYSGVDLVQTFGQHTWAQTQFEQRNSDVRRVGIQAQAISGIIGPATTFLGNLGYVAVALVGGLQMATGQLSLGGVQAFIQYVRQFNQPIGQLASMQNMLLVGTASARRVFDLLDAPEPGPEVVATVAPDEIVTDRVEFDHVNFGYRRDALVIDDLSLVAEAGHTVAIVGATGAGKTTLVNLLMGFYEIDSGRILLGGVDIATVDRKWLRSRIGMVLQDSWIFTGTIADNIGYGRPGASREDIVAAATAANVDQFVRTLRDRYDTVLSEDGGNLSAGQKQLITIARAFLAHPQLLILDEATSSVDTRTEVLVQHALATLRRGRTCFVIAHRLSTVRDADVILVMESGRIVEQGNHTELMARRGAYFAMTRASAAEDTADEPYPGFRHRDRADR